MAILSGVLAVGIGVAAVGCGGGQLGTISVYNREDGSGTRSAFLELLELEGADLAPSAGEFDATQGVMNAVSKDINGIGYISLGSVDGTIKAVEVEGVEASTENVLSGDYKISRPFELMYQEENYEENDLLRDFITFLESADAQPYISGYGYISTVSNAPAYVKPTEAFKTTDLTIGGSTSVLPLMGTNDGDKICLVEAYKEACGQNVNITVSGGGSGVGITNAGNGTLDIGMASKAVSESDFESPTGTMVIHQLCMDGIAVIVNTENTISNLTIAQLQDIYTGKVTSWSELA